MISTSSKFSAILSLLLQLITPLSHANVDKSLASLNIDMANPHLFHPRSDLNSTNNNLMVTIGAHIKLNKLVTNPYRAFKKPLAILTTPGLKLSSDCYKTSLTTTLLIKNSFR